MSVVSENDQIVGRCLLELFRRAPGACDGICVTYHQALCLLGGLPQETYPRVPNLRIRFVLTQLEQIVGPKLDGSPGFSLWLGWNSDKLFFLTIGDCHLTSRERSALDDLGRLAHAEVYLPDDGVRFCWFDQ